MSSFKTMLLNAWYHVWDAYLVWLDTPTASYVVLSFVGFATSGLGFYLSQFFIPKVQAPWPIIVGLLVGWSIPALWAWWRYRKGADRVWLLVAVGLPILVTSFLPYWFHGWEISQYYASGNHLWDKIERANFVAEMFFAFTFIWLPPVIALMVVPGTMVRWKQVPKNRPHHQMYGSARLAAENDFRKWGLYNDNGTLLGKDKRHRPLRMPENQALESRLILAPSGTGKDASIAIPVLLNEARSMVVNDVKGELWAVTARTRRQGWGQERTLTVFDPFRVRRSLGVEPVAIEPTYFNPLAHISADPYERARTVTALVSALVITDPSKPIKSHWDSYAEIILTGLIHFILDTTPEEETPTLVQVHDALTLSPKQSENFWNEMMQHENAAARSAASKVLQTGEDERGSLLSSTYQHVAWLQDPNMREAVSQNNVTFEGLLNSTQDVFIIVPEDQLKIHARYVRMIITCVITFLQQQPLTAKPKRDILFLLNELGQLGYCSVIEEAITILRARGARIWAFFQSRDQMKVYAKPKLFEDMDVKHFFGIDDLETLKWVQELAGKQTFVSKTGNSSRQNRPDFTSNQNQGQNWSTAAADLLPLNVLWEMSPHEQLVFIRGKQPVWCKKLKYWEDAIFWGLFDRNPYVEG